MPYTTKDLNEQIRKVSEGETLLDMLLEFEAVLDDLDLYAYQNWDQGEILYGPDVGRHFVNVGLMYPGELMPDPEGARRLLNLGIPVKFEKDTLTYAVKPKQGEVKQHIEDNLVGGTGHNHIRRIRNQKATMPVWIVTIQMPRRYLDSSVQEYVEVGEDDMISTDSLNDVTAQQAQQSMNPEADIDMADLDDTQAGGL